MLSLETSIQQLVKVELQTYEINDLVSGLPELGRALALRIGAQLLDQVQALLFAELSAGMRDLVCERCGILHGGQTTLLRRGSRTRRLKTSSGVLVFALRQLTCRDCGRTWSPFAEWLGLIPISLTTCSFCSSWD